MFEPEKLTEYKIRILLSLMIILLVVFLISFIGVIGTGSIEVVLIGVGFSVVSLFHAAWAIFKIKRL